MTPELTIATKDACAQLDTAEGGLRAAAALVNDLGTLASALQREAQDAEFTVGAGFRSHLDGNLLQRTGYLNTTSARIAHDLRLLAAGIRDLRADCEAIHSGRAATQIEAAEVRRAGGST